MQPATHRLPLIVVGSDVSLAYLVVPDLDSGAVKFPSQSISASRNCCDFAMTDIEEGYCDEVADDQIGNVEPHADIDGVAWLGFKRAGRRSHATEEGRSCRLYRGHAG